MFCSQMKVDSTFQTVIDVFVSGEGPVRDMPSVTLWNLTDLVEGLLWCWTEFVCRDAQTSMS